MDLTDMVLVPLPVLRRLRVKVYAPYAERIACRLCIPVGAAAECEKRLGDVDVRMPIVKAQLARSDDMPYGSKR